MANEANDHKDELFRTCEFAGRTLRVTADGAAVEQFTAAGWVPLALLPDRWNSGYTRVRVRGAGKYVTVHKAVALAWCGPPPSPAHRLVEHRDGVRQRNNAGNVRWATFADNLNSAIRLGERPRFAPRVFDEAEVYRIRRHRSRAELAAVAAEFEAGEQTVRNIFDRRTWKHVRDDQPRLF